MLPLILQLNVAGNPVEWIPWKGAACLYGRGMVAWTAGARSFDIYGGISRLTGQRSSITLNSIIAIRSRGGSSIYRKTIPPLTNKELFFRDAHLCLYCGREFKTSELTRDHVSPISRGGKDVWSNVVSACRCCNMKKGGRTPEEAKMQLLAIPYVPNWAEYLALSNHRILTDQMSFLKMQFSDRPMPFHTKNSKDLRRGK